MTFNNNVNLKIMHNRRYNHSKLVNINQYWKHYCQTRESLGLPIIKRPKKEMVHSIYRQLLAYVKILDNTPRDTKQFTNADNKNEKLMFNNISPQGFIKIVKDLKHPLSEYEMAEIIAISKITKDINKKIISNRIAKKIINKLYTRKKIK